MSTFTLYSRGYCHLCDDMLAALQLLKADFAFDVAVVDVDADGNEQALALYDELVPILLGSNSEAPLCHYFFDEAAVRAYLATA